MPISKDLSGDCLVEPPVRNGESECPSADWARIVIRIQIVSRRLMEAQIKGALWSLPSEYDLPVRDTTREESGDFAGELVGAPDLCRADDLRVPLTAIVDLHRRRPAFRIGQAARERDVDSILGPRVIFRSIQ